VKGGRSVTLPYEVSKAAVRHFLLDLQHLSSNIDGSVSVPDVLSMIRALECVQIDPVAAVERNQHLALFARMPSYVPASMETLLVERRVFEYVANAACVMPIEDYPIFEGVRQRFRNRLRPELDRYADVVQAVQKRLEAEGPLPSQAFASKTKVHGYWDNQQAKTKVTSHVLNLLNDVGAIQVVKRIGTTRYFDICARSVPAPLLYEADKMDAAEARERLIDKYIRAYRVFDIRDTRFGWQPLTAAERRAVVQQRIAADEIVPLRIQGVVHPYFIAADDLDRLRAHEENARHKLREMHTVQFLPPLDNLLWRRDRLADLFDFSYTWEVYMPQSKRRFGYYAMPILAGDTLIGRIDPRLERNEKRLDVRLLQIEQSVRWTKSLQKRVEEALAMFAAFHQATEIRIERTEPAERQFGNTTIFHN